MFESLDDRMKMDEKEVTSTKERVLKYVVVGVVSLLVFVGLYMGITLLE